MNARAEFPTRAKLRVLPDGWDVHHDNRLRVTGGVYSKVAVLSDEWGIAETALITRWHKLRGVCGVEVRRPSGAKPKAKKSAGHTDQGERRRGGIKADIVKMRRPCLSVVRDVAKTMAPTRARILLEIAKRPGATTQQLADRSGLSIGGASSTISGLRRNLLVHGWSIEAVATGGYYLVVIA
ncbi:winged helix-turn-helix domain-containing protein [Roseovarius sp.]|uniref:winged helix-turn-helix domain-containing protein n=1 Tax=Roseovarius sp. TaxID=1486281 RepID=UPI003D09C0DA